MLSLQTSLDKMVTSFLVVFLIPALGFTVVVFYVFHPIIPPKALTLLVIQLDSFGEFGFFILFCTGILGFTLSGLNTFVYKLFEGYVLFHHFPALTRREQRKAHLLRQEIQRCKARIKRLGSEDHVARAKLNYLMQDLQVEYDRQFPPSDDLIMPTAFGNTLKAAEAYSRQRYNIDSVSIWPRLIHVIPKTYFSMLDEKNNQLSFLLNCSILSGLLTVMCAGGAVYQLLLWYLQKNGVTYLLYFIPIDRTSDVYLQRVFLYLVIAVVAGFTVRLFYKAALFIVNEYGDLIRSTFDMFRFDLVKIFRLEPPDTLSDEFMFWGDVCDFLSINDPEMKIDFEYTHLTRAEEKWA